jgi:glycerophosphoryl diester phosphodiesterase
MTSRPLRLAHRGDWRRAPENSLAAMLAALAVPGCDGLEFDVRASREGVPIVLHDETLLRVQGISARASDLTADELARHGVPRLSDVLAGAGPGPFLDVELKEDLASSVVAALEAARGDLPARTVVSSFEPAALASVRRRAPAWPRWLNAVELSPATLRVARELGCRGVSAQWRAIDEGSLARARDEGLEIAAWTVRRRPTFERLARLGVVAVCVEGTALDG